MPISDSDLQNFIQTRGLTPKPTQTSPTAKGMSDSDMQNFAKSRGWDYDSNRMNGPTATDSWDIKPYQAPQAPEGPSIGGFVGNVFKSGANLVGGIANTVMHPIKTVQGIGNIVAGGIEELPGVSQFVDSHPDMFAGVPEQRQAFNNVVNFYANRYGGKDVGQVLQHVANTAYTDPVGFLMDASILAGGVSGGLKAVGLAGEDIGAITEGMTASERAAAVAQAAGEGQFGALAQAGQKIGEFGEAINPIGQAINLAGKGINAAIGAGKTLIPAAPTEIPEAGARIGIEPEELPVSAQVPGTAKLEGFAASSAGGVKTLENIQGAFDKVNSAIEDLKDPNFNPEEAGTNLGESMTDFKEYTTQVKNDLFESAIKNLDEKGAEVIPEQTNTEDLLNKQLVNEWQIAKTEGKYREYELPDGSTGKQLILTPLGKEIQGRLEAIQAGDLNASDLYKASQDLTSKTATFRATGGNYGFYDKLQQAMRQDLENALTNNPQIDESVKIDLAKANEYFGQRNDLINTQLGKALLNNVDNPELLLTKVVKAVKVMSVDDINAVMGALGDENTEIIRTQIMRDILDNATDFSGKIKVNGIAKAIYSYIGGEDKLQAILDPQRYATLKDIQTVSDAMIPAGKTLAKSLTPSTGIASWMSHLSQGGGVIELVTGHIATGLGLLSVSLGEIGLNMFLQSSLGRAILSNGLTLSGISAERIATINNLITSGANSGQVISEINKSQE